MAWYSQVHWFGLFSLIFVGVVYYLLRNVKGFRDSKIRKPAIIGWTGACLEVIYLSIHKIGFNQISFIVAVSFLLFALINVIIVFVTHNQPIYNTKRYKGIFKLIPRLGIWIYAIILIVNQMFVLF